MIEEKVNLMTRTIAWLSSMALVGLHAPLAMAQSTDGQVWLAPAPAAAPAPQQAAPPAVTPPRVTYVPVQPAPQQPAAPIIVVPAQSAPQQVPVAPQVVESGPATGAEGAQGQWVQTAGAGWVWVPMGATTYPIEGVPSAYLYTPTYGWTWYASPWGAGP